MAALATARCGDAIEYCSRLAKASDALGALTFEGLSELSDSRTLPVREFWLDRACRGDLAPQAFQAGWVYTHGRGAHEVEKLHALVGKGDIQIAEEAYRVALREVPASRASLWLRERFHGAPDADHWARFLQIEDDVMRGRRW